MDRLVPLVVLVVVAAGIASFIAGYVTRPVTTVHVVPQNVVLWGERFSCGSSNQAPYLAGTLRFSLTSTYQHDVVASVAYLGNWTGDTNQLVHANSTKTVAITWGPGANQSIYVTSCPVVNVTIWRVVETLRACPNPPCDDGTTPAP